MPFWFPTISHPCFLSGHSGEPALIYLSEFLFDLLLSCQSPTRIRIPLRLGASSVQLITVSTACSTGARTQRSLINAYWSEWMSESLASLIQTGLIYKSPFCLSLSTVLSALTSHQPFTLQSIRHFTLTLAWLSPSGHLDLSLGLDNEKCVCLGAVSLAASGSARAVHLSCSTLSKEQNSQNQESCLGILQLILENWL